MSDRLDTSREALTARVSRVLAALEVLSEGKVSAQRFEARGPVHGGEKQRAPKGDISTFDRQASKLERWCTEAEDITRRERAGQAKGGYLPELSSAQTRYWLIETCEGLDYQAAAQKTGLSPKQVWAIRRDAKREPRRGNPKAA